MGGTVSLRELRLHQNEPGLRTHLALLGLTVSDLHTFFSLLAAPGKNEVDVERFVNRRMALRGAAMRADVQIMAESLRVEQRDLQAELNIKMDVLLERFKLLPGSRASSSEILRSRQTQTARLKAAKVAEGAGMLAKSTAASSFKDEA